MTLETSPPRLLHFPVSHYNEKVRWALDFKRWPHVRQACVCGFHIPRVRWLTGQNKVPVLCVDGRAIAGSNHILAEIERLRPDPPLYPVEPEARRRALAIQTYFDDEVAPEVRRLFWSCCLNDRRLCARVATMGFSDAVAGVWWALSPVILPALSLNVGLDRQSLDRAQGRLNAHFDRLESEIGASGYLVGDRFSLADLAAAAVMTAIIRPPQYPYPLPEPWPAALRELRDSVAHRRGFGWVLDIYARHRGASSEIA